MRLFVAAYEELSFTLAAQRENATQSGVSQHVGDLEDSLGVKLFVRGLGAVKPTPAGTAYYAACIELLHAHERSVRAVAPFRGGHTGEITVGVTPILSRQVLAPAYARFAAANPNVAVRVIDSYFGDLADRVRAGDLTFAIVPAALSSKGLRVSLFARTPELLVSARATNLEHRAPVRLAQVKPLELSLPGAANARRRMIDAYLSANGIAPDRLLEFDTMLGTFDVIAQGRWRGIMPLIMVARELDDGSCTINPIVDPPLWLDLYLFQPARKVMDDAGAAFVVCLRAELERVHRTSAALLPPECRPARRAR